MELLRQIQLKELSALEELRRVCEGNNIRYYLAQGTLLGAAREGKFIPWDDDIDVLIPYSDLLRLMEVFPQEAKSGYKLTNHTLEEHYPLSWSKIRIAGTLSRPVRYKEIPVDWGICIDLFPIYPVSDWALLRKAEVFFFKAARKLLLSEMTQYDGPGRPLLVKVLEKVPLALRRRVMDTAIRLLARHEENTRWTYLTCKGGWLVKREMIYGKPRQLPFEGQDYPVPADYDGFLKMEYGDYMTPPPAQERGGHDLRMGDIEWKV